ncbi:MAG: hypothetical protein MJZ90_02715 [Bacteroidales bacterium]|nr:hypothetical protein [Bacteroidales bacterium]
MAITVEKNDISARFRQFRKAIVEKQIERLQRLGEMCVTQARSVPPSVGFHDQTGNLRSSIGYMVFVDGVSVHQSTFEQVSPQAAHKDGVTYDGGKKGEAYCREIGENTTGVCLVVVAGMDYATYVESKGRDVLTSAEHLAEQELPKQLAELIENIKKAGE